MELTLLLLGWLTINADSVFYLISNSSLDFVASVTHYSDRDRY
jgi:hypothetical protein